jgi:xylulokinase
MRQAPLLLGIDVSTTAVKALLLDAHGRVAAEAAHPLRLETPRPLWAEQDPETWWEGAQASIRAALAQAGAAAGEVAAIGLTGQMHGLVVLDEHGAVLRPAILWNDQRTGAQCDEIRERVGRERLLRLTGNDALTGFTAPKIVWVREAEPDVYARIRHVLLPKDYLRYRLTGGFATDVADASGTLLLDLAKRRWSEDVLATLDIPAEWLPSVFEGPDVTGTMTTEAAQTTGVAPGTPVVAGGGDQAAGAIGVGAIESGTVSVVLGTSGVVFASTPAPLADGEGRVHAFCHAVPDRWHVMGVTLAAAGSLQWFRDTLCTDTSFETLMAEAAGVPPGSEGLVFLPYLAGERTPYPDPYARGAFVGLTLRHRRGHLVRAVLEGVACSLRQCLELVDEVTMASATRVMVSGGGARSQLWCEIVASVCGLAVEQLGDREGAAFGAALLAGVGAGVWPDVAAACATAPVETQRVAPRADDSGELARSRDVYDALYQTLKPTFARVGGATT